MVVHAFDRASHFLAQTRSRVLTLGTRARSIPPRHVTGAMALAAALCTDPSTIAAPSVLGSSVAVCKLAAQVITFWGLVSLTTRWKGSVAAVCSAASLLAVALRWHFWINENTSSQDDGFELLALGWQFAVASYLWTHRDATSADVARSEASDLVEIDGEVVADDPSDQPALIEAA